MNEYGWVIINDKYTGVIKSIKNYNFIGTYRKQTEDEPTEYPELVWEEFVIECYELPQDEDIESIVIKEIKLDGYFEFNIDLEVIKKYYDHHSLCMVVYAK